MDRKYLLNIYISNFQDVVQLRSILLVFFELFIAILNLRGFEFLFGFHAVEIF